MKQNVNDAHSVANNQESVAWYAPAFVHSPLIDNGMERTSLELDTHCAPGTASEECPLLKIQDIHDARERLFLAVEGANDGLWDWNINSGEVYFSPRWKELLGYTEVEIPHRFEEWVKRIHPDDCRQVLVTLQRHLDGYTSHYHLEHRLRHKDGSYRWILARGASLRDANDKPYRLVGWHTDITESKQVEEEQRVRARYETLRADVNQVLTARSPLPTMLHRCCEALVQHLDVPFARIWTLNRDKNALELQANAGSYVPLAGVHSRIPIGTVEAEFIARRSEPYLTNDAFNDAHIRDKQWVRNEDMLAFAGFPLIVEDRVVGVMIVFTRQKFTDDARSVLTLVANVIAQGIGRKWAEECLEESVQKHTEELALLLKVSHAIASTLELRPLLNTILVQIKTVVDYTGAAILGIQEDRLTLLDYQGPLLPAQMQQLLKLFDQSPAYRWILQQREAVFRDDLNTDIQFTQAYIKESGEDEQQAEKVLDQIRSWIAIPLIVHEHTIGILTLHHRLSHFYTHQHARLAFALASQVAVALENAYLYEQAQVLAALQERQHLARELHDSITQAFYGINLGARTAREALETDPREALVPIEHVIMHTEAGLAETRALLFELRPESLETEGLIAALQKQVAVLRARYQLRVDVLLDDEPAISMDSKHALNRIAQEAIHNAVKHAQASTITLRLKCDNQSLMLEVRDDGRGFDAMGSFPGHLGLRSMQERTARLNGVLMLESAPESGTSVMVQIPLQYGRA